ncbi:hypothetical protein CFN78_13535 [Amycolatopsis antarctica]|uniref:Uncharacterized protein n=1 Tax=Amycolatopsis antarctica TaxID=1854586 RepID=A0A263D2G8_9PSEU|nr:hypothetical protein [Amycolatopsis antarctica]OZM72653.1 hypothetical protein CFN78_13535 [Amycolatopsis antarctica]
MTVEVIEVSSGDLLARRQRLLHEVNSTHEELRERVAAEVATTSEIEALESLDEVEFLLGEQP